jgi:hypothetical protein
MSGFRQRNRAFYFFLPDPNDGCQPAVAPFWLGPAGCLESTRHQRISPDHTAKQALCSFVEIAPFGDE